MQNSASSVQDSACGRGRGQGRGLKGSGKGTREAQLQSQNDKLLHRIKQLESQLRSAGGAASTGGGGAGQVTSQAMPPPQPHPSPRPGNGVGKPYTAPRRCGKFSLRRTSIRRTAQHAGYSRRRGRARREDLVSIAPRVCIDARASSRRRWTGNRKLVTRCMVRAIAITHCGSASRQQPPSDYSAQGTCLEQVAERRF